jgi:NAD(P)-dependent dehydrogenase (short-subunit alcohol dehydrogenase family)
MSTARLADRVALVTGGTGALGAAVVQRLNADGASVHATWRSETERDAFVAAHGGSVPVTLHRADVTDAQSVAALFDETGPVHILANVVGGFALAPLEETSPELWRKMLDLNATSAFLCSRAAVTGMRRARGGRIVNVAAQPALGRGAASMSAYAASKAAVLNLTYSLARELAPDGITVNAIVPSVIDTPANRAAMPDADRSTWLAPEEIAGVIAFLASDDAAIVTGTAMNLSREG